MFSDELEKISWEETTKAIYSKTDDDARRVLNKTGHLDVNDFMALISPAAAPLSGSDGPPQPKIYDGAVWQDHLDVCAALISRIHAPTRACTAGSTYNPMKRTILTEEEMVNEYKAIKKLAPFENLLLVTGENPAAAVVPTLPGRSTWQSLTSATCRLR